MAMVKLMGMMGLGMEMELGVRGEGMGTGIGMRMETGMGMGIVMALERFIAMPGSFVFIDESAASQSVCHAGYD